eukprot:4290218-Amphidinium_carterae.1
MVAEGVHYRLRDVLGDVLHYTAKQARRTCKTVYSLVAVAPTYLDPTSMSTASSTRSCGIYMLSVQQQQRRKEVPSIFEGNKHDTTSGPTTTFKNLPVELQIYMSLDSCD